jgi:hypothetical protein
MLIDKAGTSTDETIVLFPRSYNKRGDERLHSVQGVTLDGREVNIKLRVDEAMQGKENTPSIAEFSREDVKAKNPCLATPDNSPTQREGVLLFTGCEADGENRKGILSFTARWGYVLASHSEAPEPVFGVGRVAMIADSHASKTIHAEITELERTKVEGWEALVEHKRKALSDPMLFSYYGHLYMQDEEASFDPMDKDSIVEFAREAFAKYTRNGIVGGLLIRFQDEDGKMANGLAPEVFPRWKPGNTYQSADDVLGYFFRSNARYMSGVGCARVLVMPIKRYSCGPSFKNYYFLKKPEESLLKLRKRYLINNEPTISEIAFALSRREESGESFMLKYYPLGNPISSVADIGVASEASPPESVDLGVAVSPSLRPRVGLSENGSVAFPSWYSPSPVYPIGSLEPAPETPHDVHAEMPDEEHLTYEETLAPDTLENHSDDSSEAPVGESPKADGIDPIEPVESEDDLSALFSDIPEDELARIEEEERLALEESARLEKLAESARESEEAQDTENGHTLDVQPVTEKSGNPDTYGGAPGPFEDPSASGASTPPSGLRLVDNSAERSTAPESGEQDATPTHTHLQDKPVDDSQPEPEKQETSGNRMLEILQQKGLL